MERHIALSLLRHHPPRRTPLLGVSSLICLLVAAPLAWLLAVAQPALADLDCGDFGSMDEAQRHYDRLPGDPDRLDRDGDGLACEPYSGGTSPWVWALGGGVATAVVIGVTRAR